MGSGDYSSGVQELEDALWLYFQEYDLCQAECEGIIQLLPDRDFYAVIAGWCVIFKNVQIINILTNEHLNDTKIFFKNKSKCKSCDFRIRNDSGSSVSSVCQHTSSFM